MNRRIAGMGVLATLLIGTHAWAQDNAGSNDSKDPVIVIDESGKVVDENGTFTPEPGEKAGEVQVEERTQRTGERTGERAGEAAVSDTQTTRTKVEVAKEEKSGLQEEIIGIKPQVGIVNFTDVLGQDATRAAAGLTLDINLAEATDTLFFGPSTGVIYSHIGGADANFIGTDSQFGGNSSANLLQVPLNGKLGINVGNAIRLSGHGGGNLVYRSAASSIRLSPESTAQSGSDWTVFPNAGADLEFGLGGHSALILRGDYTFTSGPDMLTATIGFTAQLG